MFESGAVLYISPFYFKNGKGSKNKYFIVLKIIENNQVLIASLPTRTNKAPSLIETEHGCNNDALRCFNCYVFEAGCSITENGFSFPLKTFVYGNEVEDYSIDVLLSNYKIEGIDYQVMGKLTNEEYNNLCSCLKLSSSIKRGVKKYL